MEKKEQLLVIDPPNELKFRGPFNKPVVTEMKLTNTTEHTILFKIKTTAPRKYCVRPNFGAVSPHSHTVVEICLQAFVFDPTEKNKHKFMVQSFIVPEGTEGAADYDKLWKEVDAEQLMDSKLKCVFEVPSDAPADAPAGDSVAPNDSITKESITKVKVKEEKIKDYQSDKVETEIRQLREEGTQLRQENLKLNEQILRLRIANTKSTGVDQTYSPPVEQQIPLFYICLAIAAAFLGLLLGKYIL